MFDNVAGYLLSIGHEGAVIVISIEVAVHHFCMIADTDGKISDSYGVRMKGKSMDNRVSFLIGLDGNIVHVTNSGNAEVHLTEMKAAIAKIKG